jgi:signal transduction histidine kinase
MAAVARSADNPPAREALFELALGLVRGRWWAAAAIPAAVGLAQGWGVELPSRPFWAAFFILLAGNGWFHFDSRRRRGRLAEDPAAFRGFICGQAVLDILVLAALCVFSGGTASPLVPAFLVPLLYTALLLPDRVAYGLCAAALAALGLMALSELSGWMPQSPGPAPRGPAAPAILPRMPADAPVLIFGAVSLAAVYLARRRLAVFQRGLAEASRRQEAEADFGRRLQALLAILEAVGSTHDPGEVMQKAAAEIAGVMGVKAVSVKLLSADGKYLDYAAASGLPESLVREKAVEVARSPLNQRILNGEPYVTGQVTATEMFQFGEALSAARIRSVLFLPLPIEGRVIGILGAYCEKPDRFGDADVDFFRLAARLLAVAIENARAYVQLKAAGEERTWLMMKVAHNLRAPLVGMLSILEVVRGGYLGAINEDQNEYLRRLDRRARSMLALINELMVLSRNRERRSAPAATTDPQVLARRILRTFQDKAAEKGLAFEVAPAEQLPKICGRLENVEQVLENLVSNAIKYTPAEGRVQVRFARANGTVRIEVSDTGIGIPRAERAKVFTEFFRAENAKAMEEVGTGLGLAIAKEIVDQLGGRIFMESEENAGTVFVVHLPAAKEENR